jgi:hypothetical protein
MVHYASARNRRLIAVHSSGETVPVLRAVQLVDQFETLFRFSRARYSELMFH